MFDHCAGIHEHIASNQRARLNDCTGHDLRTLARRDIRGDHSGDVRYHRECIAKRCKAAKQFAAARQPGARPRSTIAEAIGELD